MAKATSIGWELHKQRYVENAEKKINKNYPGGLESLIRDYRKGRITLRQAQDRTKVLFRAIHRVFNKHRVQRHTREMANKIAHALNPNWGQHITTAKLKSPFKHTPSVTRSATKKRVMLWRSDPSRHGLAHTPMNIAESEFANVLDDFGISYSFNVASGGQWIDFHVPSLNLGFEIHKLGRWLASLLW